MKCSAPYDFCHTQGAFEPLTSDKCFIPHQESLVLNNIDNVGIKHDQDKLRLDLLPILAIEEIAKVLTFGAAKYGEYNWKNGLAYHRLIGAALRHLFAFIRGEDTDKETGLSHLAHCGCCILFLLSSKLNNFGTDDRKVC